MFLVQRAGMPIFNDRGTVLRSFLKGIILLFKEMLLYLHCLTRKNQYMPRQERTKSGTGIYHVMLRGINRQDIFEDAEDYLQMVACLRGLTERNDENGVAVEPLCTFYSYCLMSNHLHLLNDHRTVPWFSKRHHGLGTATANSGDGAVGMCDTDTMQQILRG